MKLAVFNGQAFSSMRCGLMVANFFLMVVCASRLQNEQSMLDTWENISVSLRFFIEFSRRPGLQMNKTSHGSLQLCNWIAYRFEIEVGFGPTKWNIFSQPFLWPQDSAISSACAQAAKIAVSILLYGKLKKLQFLDQVKVAHNAAPAVWVIRRLHKLGRVIFEVSQHCNISEKTLEKVCCNSAAFSFKKSLDLNMRTCHRVNVHLRLQWCAGMPHSVGRSMVANSKYVKNDFITSNSFIDFHWRTWGVHFAQSFCGRAPKVCLLLQS